MSEPTTETVRSTDSPGGAPDVPVRQGAEHHSFPVSGADQGRHTEIVRNEFGERVYSLSDFAEDGVAVDHALTGRRIPVLQHCHARFKYHTALVVGGPEWGCEHDLGQEPEPFEVEQLCADLEYRMAYYNDAYRARVAARGPFDVDGTVNTHTFRKHAEHGWQYHVLTWTQGPTWFPTPPWNKVGPLTLEALLDRVHSFGDGAQSSRWLGVKADSGAFSAPTNMPELRPGDGS